MQPQKVIGALNPKPFYAGQLLIRFYIFPSQEMLVGF